VITEDILVEWRHEVPWNGWEQVEQDLIITRAIVEIFNDEYLAKNLAFRGGTALHKLYFTPAMRYSEDIDLVQTAKGPVGPIFDRLRVALSFLGEPKKTVRKSRGNKMIFKIDATMPPIPTLKLKIEMNSVEGNSIFGYEYLSFELDTRWFAGQCTATTYSLDELMGTKLRALYQRKKGRDLFDLWAALESGRVDPARVAEAFRHYASVSDRSYPSSEVLLENLTLKMEDEGFISDIDALIRPGIRYRPQDAYELVCKQLLSEI
jgi:predicted nucleotidyltransferase component of viral defense system